MCASLSGDGLRVRNDRTNLAPTSPEDGAGRFSRKEQMPSSPPPPPFPHSTTSGLCLLSAPSLYEIRGRRETKRARGGGGGGESLSHKSDTFRRAAAKKGRERTRSETFISRAISEDSSTSTAVKRLLDYYTPPSLLFLPPATLFC